MLASLTQWVQDTVSAHGIAAVFGLMVLESACIPIPSEVTMIFAGFLVSQGHMGFLEAVLAGAFANLVGSWLAWAVGLYGVDSLLVRSRRSRRHLDEATRWFERYGAPVVFFSRMVPVVRTFISLPAGMAGMPFGRFSALTFAGCVPWCALLVAIGDVAGSHWDEWHDRLRFVDYGVVVLAFAIGGWWLLRRRRTVGNLPR